MNGPHTAFVVVRKKLSFVRGHVHRYRALTFASFAGETEIERFLHLLTLPAICDHPALQHLPKQSRPSARRMLLLHSHAIARAHRLMPGLAALADADTAKYGARKTSLVFRPMEMRRDIGGAIVSADAQILSDIIRIDDLAGIHPPFGIPNRFELAKSLNQFRPEHLWQQPGARLSIAMFTRQ